MIGDVPELGTAIGDGLALALAQLRRTDAKSKVVILLSDGDSNWVTRFDPDEAARAAQDDGRQGLHAARRPRGDRPVRRHVGQPGDAAQHRAR